MGRYCEHEGCRKWPAFGAPGGRARHCASHRADGEVDILHRRCAHEECQKHPSFGALGGRARHCVAHRADGEVDVKKQLCTHEGCPKRPSFGAPGRSARHCAAHRADGEVDVKNQRRAPAGGRRAQPAHRRLTPAAGVKRSLAAECLPEDEREAKRPRLE